MTSINISVIDFKKVFNLMGEYMADSNCYASLWINGEDVNQDEKIFFLAMIADAKKLLQQA